MRSFRLFCLFVVLALSLEAAWNPTCTSFIYVNGVSTTNLGAAATVTDKLVPQFRDYLAGKGKSGVCYSIHLSYNRNDSFALDMVEAAQQFGLQNNALNPYQNHEELLSGASSQIQSAYTFASTTTPSTNLVSTFGKTSQSTTPLITILSSLTTEQSSTLNLLVNNLLTEIENGRSAVCIGYSQGNFYCNLAYRVIREDTSGRLTNLGLSLPNQNVLKVVGIATPANFTADSRNEYVTVCKDIIVATPNSLPPNFPSPSSCTTRWWDSVWSAVTSPQFWLGPFAGLIDTGVVGFNDHLISTYLTIGTAVQNRVMQLLENALTPPMIYTLGPSNCSVVWITNYYYGGGQHDGNMRTGGWGDTYYSLLKCGLSGMPAVATKATLRLYEYPLQGSRSQIYLDRVTSQWDNNTKWSNKPTSVNITTLPTPVDNQWYEIDITDLYNKWQNGAYANYGVMLRATSNNNIFNTFRSPEYVDQNFRPQLAVSYVTGSLPTNNAPAVTIVGANPMTVAVGATFIEPGYTATDTEDGNITSRVTVSGSINTSVAGTYTRTYNVTDSGGLSATPATRTVVVYNPAPQSLTGSCSVNGSLNSITIQTGNTAYYSAGFSGGTSPIHFLWTGATGGDSSGTSQVYNYAGLYTASVRITDSGSPQQQVTVTCPQVNVTTTVVAPFATSCYITPSTVKFGGSAMYTANASGGYPPYIFNVPGTPYSQSPFNAITTITPNRTDVISYQGVVQDSHGQVQMPTCSVTVTP